MGKKILLADDSITIQKVIELTFSDEDFDVVTVGNGRLAVEKVQEVRPDVVLCDIIMPEKDGYEVCDFIKRNASLSHIPVLLLTGAFEPFDQERAARVGCDGFLAKPFEPETLIAKVKDLLKKVASRSGPHAPLRAPGAEPFPTASREPAPHPAAPAPSTLPPPPRPPEPIPFPTAALRPPGTEPPSPPAHTPEVRFIPDEPFADLDAASFPADTATASFGTPPDRKSVV
jgi:CheY-like chemotaxis protein